MIEVKAASKVNQQLVKPGDLVRFARRWDNETPDAWELGLVVRTWISNVSTQIITGERIPHWSVKVIKGDGSIKQFGLTQMTVEVVQRATDSA